MQDLQGPTPTGRAAIHEMGLWQEAPHYPNHLSGLHLLNAVDRLLVAEGAAEEAAGETG